MRFRNERQPETSACSSNLDAHVRSHREQLDVRYVQGYHSEDCQLRLLQLLESKRRCYDLSTERQVRSKGKGYLKPLGT